MASFVVRRIVRIRLERTIKQSDELTQLILNYRFLRHQRLFWNNFWFRGDQRVIFFLDDLRWNICVIADDDEGYRTSDSNDRNSHPNPPT